MPIRRSTSGLIAPGLPRRGLRTCIILCTGLDALTATARSSTDAAPEPGSTSPSSPPEPAPRATDSSRASAAASEDETAEYGFRPEWRRFGVWDYLGTAGTLGAFYTIEFTLGPPKRVHWSEPVPLLDPPVRSLLRLRTRQARERADRASDYFWYASIAYPVVDAIATPLIRGANFDMVWQLGMMNLQAYALISPVIRIPHKTLGRMRPNTLGCEEDPEYTEQCDSPTARRVSFPGGHYGVSMTGAGLSCAHHLHADLYGGGTADSAACAGALVAANVVNVLRLNSDKHWFTDQIAGGLAGFFIGYGLPTWLYYKPFWRDPEAAAPREAPLEEEGSSRSLPFGWTVLPQLGENQIGISAAGVF